MTLLSHSVSSVAANTVKYLSCRSSLKTEWSAELRESVPNSVWECGFLRGPGLLATTCRQPRNFARWYFRFICLLRIWNDGSSSCRIKCSGKMCGQTWNDDPLGCFYGISIWGPIHAIIKRRKHHAWHIWILPLLCTHTKLWPFRK